MRYGTPADFRVQVIDGGFTDTADTVLAHIDDHYGRNRLIEDMLLSHADNDHACGLVGVLKYSDTRNLWMNRPWHYAPQIIDSFHGNWTLAGLTQEIKDKHPYLMEMEDIARTRGIPIHSVFAGARIGACFTVLAPTQQRYISLLPDLGKTPQSYQENKGLLGAVLGGARNVLDQVREAWDIETLDDNPPATSASNETSVVQMGVFGLRRALFTADVGPEGLREAAHIARALGLLGHRISCRCRTTAAAARHPVCAQRVARAAPAGPQRVTWHGVLLGWPGRGHLPAQEGQERLHSPRVRGARDAWVQLAASARLGRSRRLYRLDARSLRSQRQRRGVGMFGLPDTYTIKARIFPALLAVLPGLALAAVMVSWRQLGISHVIATGAAMVLMYAFSDLARRWARAWRTGCSAKWAASRRPRCCGIATNGLTPAPKPVGATSWAGVSRKSRRRRRQNAPILVPLTHSMVAAGIGCGSTRATTRNSS